MWRNGELPFRLGLLKYNITQQLTISAYFAKMGKINYNVSNIDLSIKYINIVKLLKEQIINDKTTFDDLSSNIIKSSIQDLYAR